jgi:hypothetical protein
MANEILPESFESYTTEALQSIVRQFGYDSQAAKTAMCALALRRLGSKTL